MCFPTLNMIELEVELVAKDYEVHMSISIHDYEAFDRFARNRIAVHPPKSLDELFETWNEMKEIEATISSVNEGLEDVEAGRVKPAEQAMRDIRERLGWEK